MEGLDRYLRRAGLPPEVATRYAAMDAATGGADAYFAVGGPPLARSVWGDVSASAEFQFRLAPTRPEIHETMVECLRFVGQTIEADRVYEDTPHRALFSHYLIDGLRQRKFFGLAIPRDYGGEGGLLSELGPFLSALTLLHPDLAILFEVHGVLGPVSPLLLFGTEAQKRLYLPRLARGELLGSFMLTEAGAGGDPSMLVTTATLEGDRYRLNGNKAFITNCTTHYGPMLAAAVVRLEGHNLPARKNYGMLLLEIAEDGTSPGVPAPTTRTVQIERNHLLAFDALFNARVMFYDHAVAASCLLGAPGNGLVQAFASLERGRMGICANAVGKIRRMLTEVIGNGVEKGWLHIRTTFGELIVTRPRLLEYLGRGAMSVVAAEALRDWCAWLGDQRRRDEAAGFVAKLYASEALFDAVISAFRMQGGRSAFADNYIATHIIDYLMALIYEGPNEILQAMGGPGALVREIRGKYLDPALAAMTPRFENEDLAVYRERTAGWMGKVLKVVKLFAGIYLTPSRSNVDVQGLTPDLRAYVRRALVRNRSIGRRYVELLAWHQLAFAQRTLETARLFEKLTFSTSALLTAIAVRDRGPIYHRIARAAHLQAECKFNGLEPTLELSRLWAQIGHEVATPGRPLFSDMVEGIQFGGVSLDPRRLGDYFPPRG